MSGIDWKKLRADATTILEGDFNIVISDAKPGVSSTKKPMIKCTLVVESGPFAGRKVYHNFTISPESPIAMQMFFRAMTTLGLGEEFFATQPSEEAIAQGLLGKRATVAIEKREWQGQERENVKSWSAASGPAGPSMGMPTIAVTSGSGVPDLSGMTAAPLGGQPSTPAPDLGPDPF